MILFGTHTEMRKELAKDLEQLRNQNTYRCKQNQFLLLVLRRANKICLM